MGFSFFYHFSCQDPLLSVSFELQYFIKAMIISIFATWKIKYQYLDSSYKYPNLTCEVDSIVHSGQPHLVHGPGQQASQESPGAGAWWEYLCGVQLIIACLCASSDQQNLARSSSKG